MSDSTNPLIARPPGAGASGNSKSFNWSFLRSKRFLWIVGIFILVIAALIIIASVASKPESFEILTPQDLAFNGLVVDRPFEYMPVGSVEGDVVPRIPNRLDEMVNAYERRTDERLSRVPRVHPETFATRPLGRGKPADSMPRYAKMFPNAADQPGGDFGRDRPAYPFM